MKIALIEDELDLKDAIQTLLELEGYDLDGYKNLTEFLKSDILYDIIIADINLPDGNFLDEFAKHPLLYDKSLVIIISGNHNLENIKKSFELGAIDFLKKPFEIEELIIRIQRFENRNKNIKLSDNIIYRSKDKTLLINNKEIPLTQKESKFLDILISKKGSYVSFYELERKIWDEPIQPNTLAALVKRVRKKLNSSDIIISKRNLGYKIKSF